MDPRRLRVGEWLIATAGVLAIVALFLPWYDEALSGWEALAVVDVLLATCGLAGLGVAALTAWARSPSPAIAAEALLTFLGGAALLAVAIRVASVPDGLAGRAIGQWLGLAAAAAMVGGALIAMRDERRSAPGRLTDPTGVPVTAAPEVETLPAPPRAAS